MIRLDIHLVETGCYATRARAADAIKRGAVTLDGAVVTKPGLAVREGAAISIDDPAAGYVSRAALKLIAALDQFGFDPAGRHALDLGASTGGFTQVLLERGAAHVTAIDVGVGQMDGTIADDPRVTAINGVNARDLAVDHLIAPPDAITVDLSFISLKKAITPALRLAAPGAWLIALIKPQFEAGPNDVGKGGIVRDPAVHARVCDDVAAFLERADWAVRSQLPSPVRGGDGNVEFLIGACKAG